MEANKDTPPQPDGFRRIVLCLDSFEASRCTAAFVRRLARPDTELTIVALTLDPDSLASQTPLGGPDSGLAHGKSQELMNRAIAESSRALASSVATLRTQAIDLAKAGVSAARALGREAQQVRADLLIVGIRQHHGLVRWFDPSVTNSLSRLAPCAMIVAPAEYDDARNAELQRILFAVDGSATSLAAVDTGASLASADTQIRVVYVVDRAISRSHVTPGTPLEDIYVKEGSQAIAAAQARLEARREVTRSLVSTDLISTDAGADNVSSVLLREAQHWNADVIVMGTHGRRGDARAYLGSVPNQVASLVEIPLLLVRESHDNRASNAT